MSDIKGLTDFQRANRNSLETLGMELRKQLSFLEESIREDRLKLVSYKEEFGDLYYRPKTGPNERGLPTEAVLRPLVSEYRATIKSLLDSLTLIENKLSVDTGKGEGSTGIEGDYIGEEEFNAEEYLEQAKRRGAKDKG